MTEGNLKKKKKPTTDTPGWAAFLFTMEKNVARKRVNKKYDLTGVRDKNKK